MSTRSRSVRAVLGIGLAGGVALGALAGPAGAEVSGPCQGTIKGVDVASVSSADIDDAIPVGQTESVAVGATAAGELERYKIQLGFAGINWTVAKGTADGTSWSKTVEVDDYARYGVGLYKVTGVSSGGVSCSGAALVKVDGSPFGSIAGIVGAALTVIGVGAVATNTLKGLKGGPRPSQAVTSAASDPSAPVERVIVDAKSPRDYVHAVQAICTYNPSRYPPLVEKVCGNEFLDRRRIICRWG
jgi:hypothetical protein